MSAEGPIIIRKKRDDDEGNHHGGVWKLAFADFMTAMMAFFLVMWLINSTSKETKAVIVQYFNPVKLVDATNAHKGLHEPSNGAQGKSAIPPTSKGDAPGGPKDNSEALFADPIKALDELAATELPRESLRDPFERPNKARSMESASSPTETSAEKSKELEKQSKSSDTAKAKTQLQAEINEILAREGAAPKIEVHKSDAGLLVSLTDDANFSMFDVGSVRPKPQLVRIIGEIGKILAKKDGEVEIRGYTDARVYAGKNYDNWRLSSDRANIVNYMLIRGGLPSARIVQISGFADRHLKNPREPMAPVNRRIEILLRDAS